MKVDPMARVGLDHGLVLARLHRLRERFGDSRRDRRQFRVAGVETVSTAKRNVGGTRDDEDGAAEGRARGTASQSEEFADGGGLFGLFGEREDVRVVASGEEEGEEVGPFIRGGQVARRVIETFHHGVAGTETGLVEAGDFEVGGRGEERDEGLVGAEARQDDAVGEFGAGGCEDVGLYGAEGVSVS